MSISFSGTQPAWSPPPDDMPKMLQIWYLYLQHFSMNIYDCPDIGRSLNQADCCRSGLRQP